MGYYAVNGLVIRCSGKNSTVEIENPDIFTNSYINIESDNSYIKIKNAKYVRNLDVLVYQGYNQKFIFGVNSSVEDAKVFLCGANVECIIGDECMLSSGIEIWTSDGHSIIDIASNEIINDVSAPLVIGDRCWIGREVRILKNANIPPDTIVGAGAVIAKCFVERFTALAGNPAKVIKKSVMWDRGIPHELKKER
ncbi:MAG: hypothetical protein LBG46_04255, partial [Elusimicrobiota bacterium]|nr:hypothetical protein [Elusimicrobiota bacterium]